MTKTEMKLLSRIDEVLGSMHGVDQECVLAPRREELRHSRFCLNMGLLNAKGLAFVEQQVSTREKQYL